MGKVWAYWATTEGLSDKMSRDFVVVCSSSGNSRCKGPEAGMDFAYCATVRRPVWLEWCKQKGWAEV